MNQIYTVKQHDAKDCGAACLCTISRFTGRKYSLRYLRKITHTGQNGVTMQGLSAGAEYIGLKADAYEGNVEDLFSCLKEEKIPVVVHLRTNHFVVVYKMTDKSVYVSDPAIGKYKMSWEKFNETWSGYLLVFSDTAEREKNVHEKKEPNLVLEAVKKNWKGLLLIIALSWALIGISLCSTYMFQILLELGEEHAQAHDHEEANLLIHFLMEIASHGIKRLFLFMIILTVIMAVVGYLRDMSVAILSKKMDVSFMEEYSKKLFRASISEINSRMSGDYISRTSDLMMVRGMISGLLVSFLFNVNLFVIGSVLLFRISIQLYFVALGTIVFYGLLAFSLKKPLTSINHSAMNANAAVQSYVKESIQGIEFIKANNMDGRVQARLMNKHKSYVEKLYRGNLLSAYSNSGSAFIEQTSNLIIIFTGFSFVNSGVMSLGELMTFFMLLSLLSNSSKQILGMQQSFQAGLVATDRLNDVRCMDEDSDGDIKIDKINKIQVENVGFTYFGCPKLFNHVSLELSGRKKYVIVGKNGCGKSTLLRLITGMEKPTEGKVLVNGIEMERLSLRELRDRICLVTQNNFLFADTLLYNVTLGNDYPMEEVETACNHAGLSDLIKKMPQGLNTFIDENAVNLSAGQKQAIAIARALLKKPDVLILDEATSNMDAEREEKIISRLMDLEIPCLFVTHNQAIASKADHVLELGRFSLSEAESGELYKEIKEDELCVS